MRMQYPILEEVFSTSSVTLYRKGEIIIRPDDTPQGVYFLIKGFVRFYALSREGQELTFLIFRSGDFFPARFAFTNQPIQYYYETLTAVEVKRVATEEFQTFLKENPETLFAITGSILIRLRTIFERMEYLVYGNAYEKVASILYVFAKEYGEKEGGDIVITVPLTHKDIAAVVGMTRETVSVEMSKLAEKGLISHEGKFVLVKQLKQLKQESLLKSQ